MNEFIGSAAQISIDEGAADIDLSQLTRIDEEIWTSLADHSDAYIEQQAKELESKAIKLEAWLSQMTLRERAEMDKIYPFSVIEFEQKEQAIIGAWQLRKKMQKAIAEQEAEGEVFEEENKALAAISPELEAQYQQVIGLRNKQVENYVEENNMKEVLKIDEEEMQKILDLVT